MNRRYEPQVCREGTGRVPSDALLHQIEPGYMSAAPGRRPVGTCVACKRAPCEFNFDISTGQPPVLCWIYDHKRRRNEIRKCPVRTRKSTASRLVGKSYGARWIYESPFSGADISKIIIA